RRLSSSSLTTLVPAPWQGRQSSAPSIRTGGTYRGLPRVVWQCGCRPSPSWTRVCLERIARGSPCGLWKKFEQAHAWWVQHGCPEVSGFGLTVGPRSHVVWPGYSGGPHVTIEGTMLGKTVYSVVCSEAAHNPDNEEITPRKIAGHLL